MWRKSKNTKWREAHRLFNSPLLASLPRTRRWIRVENRSLSLYYLLRPEVCLFYAVARWEHCFSYQINVFLEVFMEKWGRHLTKILFRMDKQLKLPDLECCVIIMGSCGYWGLWVSAKEFMLRIACAAAVRQWLGWNHPNWKQLLTHAMPPVRTGRFCQLETGMGAGLNI